MNRPFVKSLRADWINVLFGAWVAVSPFVLGFARDRELRWDNIAVGLAVILLSFASEKLWMARGLKVLLGGWLLVSTFYFGFSKAIVTWNNFVMGILIIVGTILAESMRP